MRIELQTLTHRRYGKCSEISKNLGNNALKKNILNKAYIITK